jgi:hypothetical protein
VGSIFGKKVLEDPEPFGLKRLDFDKLPDQKVVTDREAQLLPADKGMAATLRPLLAGTQLEAAPLRCGRHKEPVCQESMQQEELVDTVPKQLQCSPWQTQHHTCAAMAGNSL